MEPKTTKKPSRKLVVFKRELPFYLMLIPGVTFLIIFSYLPMFGLVMAFQDFTPLRSFKNSPWVGLKNFRDMLALPTFWNVVGNTLSISIAKIILRLLVPLILALLLNEVVHPKFMRMAQTVFFLPYFLSWAVMGGVLRNLFQYDGMVNELLGRIGIDPIMFLGSNTWFPIIIILSDVWKDMGYNMIIFLAAITGVDPALNESAALDGANRWQQIWHITLPTIRPIVVMLLVLSLGSVLSAGMEQIMLLYNPMQAAPDVKYWVNNGKTSSPRTAFTALEQLKQAHPGITAVLTWGDIYAAGALQYLYQQNLRVPQDVEVVTCGDTLVPYSAPAISSVEVPLREMARTAVAIINDQLADGQKDFVKTVTLEPRFTRRGV